MVDGLPTPDVRLHSVPRRFDLTTVLVVTLAYSLLFGGLRLLRLRPMAVSEVAGFVTCVAIGQALLFGGKKPRLSSVLVGVICLLGIYLVYALTRDASLFEFHHRVLLIWLSIAIAGAISGYFAGVAIGLVFLVSHVTKQSLRRTRSR